ncbi:polysaccharide lyase family 8 super-sandwich domain-containing protein [Paenibacillus solani]|uniref:polysaccharide lyase family 8 super-sandwich domain-containing protein n=1 Tax=Paenibacillus solani TaxID=1705565 RepID=UPI003D2D99EC
MDIKKKQISIIVVFCMTIQLVFAGLPIFNGQVYASTQTDPAANMLVNGGFENGALTPHADWTGGKPEGWSVWKPTPGGQVSVTESVYHSGTHAVEIRHDTTARTAVSLSPLAPVTPGQSYTMQFWLKTDNVQPADVSKGVYIRTQFCAESGTKIQDGPSIPFVKGTSDWTLYELNIQIPNDAQVTRFKIEALLETGTGTFWMDDVSLVPEKGLIALDISPKSANTKKGETLQLTPIATPAGEPLDGLAWSSSNPAVASVQNGLVTAVDHGSTDIEVRTSDGKHSALSRIYVESEAQLQAYDLVRQKWASKLAGGSGIDRNDPDVAANLEALVKRMTNPEKTGRWDTMNKAADPDALWPGVISKTQNDSWRISWAYGIIRDLSLAYSIEGSSLYKNEELKQDIVRAMDWMYRHHYNSGKNITGNWWDWEIGTPQEIMNILSLMYDAIPPAMLDQYLAVIDRFVPDPKKRVANSAAVETGANLLDKALVVTLRGIVGKQEAKVLQGRVAINNEFLYVKQGDGLYEDGSLVQHKNIAYTGGYGAVLLGRMADLFFLFEGSPWPITDPNAGNVYNWVEDSFEPLIYKGAIMDSVKGRSISRAADSDHITGHMIIMTLLRLAESAPADQAARIKSMVKEWALTDTTFDNYYTGLPLYELNLLKKLMQDQSISRRGEVVHTQMFAGMDRAVQLRPEFGLGISMFSDRISAFEYGNGENKKGWYTGIGMTSLYNNDLKQFSNQYWPTVDSYRLPGTTTDGSYKAPAEWGYYMNPKDWVGGSVLDHYYGALGMEFSLSGSTGSPLQGKKSWFLFDDEMVAVGSDIANTSANLTETIVENRQLTDTGTNRLIVDGREMPSQLGWQDKLANVKWVHLEGNVAGSDIGYVFPSGQEVAGKREARSGSWRDINTSGPTDVITRNYLSLAVEHGVSPQAGTYEYVLLPGKTPEQTAAYAVNPDIQVLAASERVHAVKELKHNVTGMNFWKAGAFQHVKTDKPVSLMLKESGDLLTVAVAEPTQKQGTVIVDIGKLGFEVMSKDPSVTVMQTFPYTRLAIDTQSTAGKTYAITLKIDPNQTISMEGSEPAAGEVVNVPVAEDTFVRDGSFAGTNQGNKTFLEVREAGGGYTQRSFLKFDLSGIAGEVESARLKVHGAINDNKATDTTTTVIRVHRVQDDSWKEMEMLWGSQPRYEEATASMTIGKQQKWHELDVTAQVRAEAAGDKTLSVALIEQPRNAKAWNTQIKSKEQGLQAPYLEVKLKGAPAVVVTKVAVTPASVKMKQGEQVTFTAAVKPENAHNTQTVWSMKAADQSLASLQAAGGQAVVTGLQPGTVELTATAVDGGVQASAMIVIEAAAGVPGLDPDPNPNPNPSPNPSPGPGSGLDPREGSGCDREERDRAG